MRYKIFFDASCIMASLGSPNGGSSKLLNVLLDSKHFIYTSEIALDEVRSHIVKIGSNNRKLSILIKKYKVRIIPAPKVTEVKRCYKYTNDPDDAYLIASCFLKDCSHLISLDKKHILSISERIKRPKILSPGGMIKILI